VSFIKEIIRDILYVSKVTGVTNKKLIIFLVVILSQVTAFSDVLLIVIFAAIITESVSDNFFTFVIEFFLDYKILLPFVVLVRFYVTYLLQMTMKKLEMTVTRNIKVHLLSEVFEKRNYSVADAYFYINTLSGHVAFFYSNLTSFLNSILQVSAFVLYLSVSDSEIFRILLIGIIILFYPVRYLIRKAREYMHKIYIYTQISSEEIQRIVDNTFLIKLLKKEDEELEKFNEILIKQNESDYKNIAYTSINGFLPTFMTLFVFSIIISFKRLVSSITVDFIAVTLKLFQSLGQVTDALNKIINSHVHISKLYEILLNRNKVDRERFKFIDSQNKNAIEIENIDFQYFNSDVKIFQNLSLNIPKNTHVILTGPNGSGKSTLLGLIAGVYYSNKGEVRTYCKNFGYIGATPLIFTGSLRDNILYGNDLIVDDDKILEALKEFDLFKEESGYELDRTVDNKSLSSGQMQKIAFIRALLSDVETLILDESTANLDDKSRDLIFNILENKKITIINSTHDPEQFKNIGLHINIDIIDEVRTVKLK
tara:strand:- start:2225 stop:3841 length:1617 start_codon:yes stop_codon:yes gene_type:complete